MLRNLALIILALSLILVVSCSGGDGNAVLPTQQVSSAPEAVAANTVCLGFWQVSIDPDTATIDAVDLRSSELIINVLGFLEPPALKGLTIDFGTLEISEPVVKVDVILTHPLPDPVFMGFDVRGVVFGPRVTNSDGLTVIPSPEFFTGVPFGYQDGLLGTPNSIANYTGLAGYKYFCDGLGKDDDLATFMSDPSNLAKRGVFTQSPTKNTRHYNLDWTGSGKGFFVFNYAVYANYDWPSGGAPIDIDDFDITTANSQEAFCCKVTETANSLWYSGGTGGGTISLDVQIWDWQGNVSNVKIESLESGFIPESFFDVFVELSPYYDTYKFTNISGTPTKTGDLDLLITAIDPNTFGNSWLMGLLPGTHPMYSDPVYNCWIYTTKVVECPKPNPTSIIPGSHAPDNIQFSAIINGTDFIAGPSLAVSLKKDGQPSITATDVSYVDGTQLTCNLKIPLGAAVGFWDVEVVNGCNAAGTGVALFEVTCPVPTITDINPWYANQGTLVDNCTITGTGFLGGPLKDVRLKMTGQADIAASDVQFLSDTTITADFNLAGAKIGGWDVVVTNGCGQKVTKAEGFWVIDPACPTPTITSITPYEGNQGQIVSGVTIVGTNFADGPLKEVRLKNAPTGQGTKDDIICTITSYTTTNIKVDINITTAAIGVWTVRVTNGCGKWVEKGPPSGGFRVWCPVPTVDPGGIKPNEGEQDKTVNVVFTGKNFMPDKVTPPEAARLHKNGVWINGVIDKSKTTDTTLTVDFAIPKDAEVGLWDIYIRNSCGTGDSFPIYGGFKVKGCNPPELSWISPSNTGGGDEFPATVYGAKLLQGPYNFIVQLKTPDETTVIDATNETWISDNELACDLKIPDTVPYGKYDLHVTNACGMKSKLAEAFEVYPVVKTLTPSSAKTGTKPHITMEGWLFHSNFDAVGLAQIDPKTWQIIDIRYGYNVKFNSSKSIEFDVDLTGAGVSPYWVGGLIYDGGASQYGGGSFEVLP